MVIMPETLLVTAAQIVERHLESLRVLQRVLDPVRNDDDDCRTVWDRLHEELGLFQRFLYEISEGNILVAEAVVRREETRRELSAIFASLERVSSQRTVFAVNAAIGQLLRNLN